jgi:hypothetical protein
MESFRAVFVAVFVGTSLVTTAVLLNQRRPELEGLAGRVIYGPPPFAPLLFVNLALPAALGLWVMGGGREQMSR